MKNVYFVWIWMRVQESFVSLLENLTISNFYDNWRTTMSATSLILGKKKFHRGKKSFKVSSSNKSLLRKKSDCMHVLMSILIFLSWRRVQAKPEQWTGDPSRWKLDEVKQLNPMYWWCQHLSGVGTPLDRNSDLTSPVGSGGGGVSGIVHSVNILTVWESWLLIGMIEMS